MFEVFAVAINQPLKIAVWLYFFLCILRNSAAMESVSLQQFLHEATAQNLAFKAKGASLQAEQEGASGIKIPPFHFDIIHMQMDDGGNNTGIAIKQVIPFPTKIASEYRARQAASAAQHAAYHALEAEIISGAKYLYFRLWAAEERVRLLQEKAQILERHLKLARAVARSDSFLKIHVLKAENDLDLLKNTIEEAQQNCRERQVEAAEFLNRDPTTYRPLVAEFPPSPLPVKEALGNPQQLAAKKYELEYSRAKEAEMHAQWLPDFTLQYKVMGATAMFPSYREMMVGATLPFAFFWEVKAESGKATAQRLASEYQFAKEQNSIAAKKATYRARAHSLQKQLALLTKELLPRAEKRKRIVNNLAPRDMETLQDQRETLEAFPDLQLRALEVRAQYEKSVMELERFQSGESGGRE